MTLLVIVLFLVLMSGASLLWGVDSRGLTDHEWERVEP